MKKGLIILSVLCVMLFSAQISEARIKHKAPIIDNTQLEEVELEISEETDDVQAPQAVSITEEETLQDKTLREKLNDIYHLEVTQYDKMNFLLKDVLTYKHPETSKMDYTHFWAGYNGDIGLHFIEDGNITNHYDYNAVNLTYEGAFKDNNADFRVQLGVSPRSHRNFASNLFADVYVATNKIPHHRVTVGNTRPPVGVEGASSPFLLPFMARSQIARNFGTVRKLGARVAGNYSLVDYDLGMYSSDTYFQEFFPGTEFIGWVNFKPLAKTGGKYGNLKLGTGIETGHRTNNYCVTGAYIGYDYKKFMANFEWAQGNGYNGPSGVSTIKHATGFYTTLGYMLTQKLQVLARYDQFDPNKEIAHNNKREYSLGFNYFIKGQALKFMLNYVFAQNDNAKDSHRIILGTQILL